MYRSLAMLALIMLAGCNLNDPNITPIPTLDIPRVEFLYPDNNSIVIEGTDLTLDILATDSSAGIAEIEVFLNGEPLRTAAPQDGVTVPSFRAELNWFAQGVGRHTLTAVASRLDGTQSEEARIIVEVRARP